MRYHLHRQKKIENLIHVFLNHFFEKCRLRSCCTLNRKNIQTSHFEIKDSGKMSQTKKNFRRLCERSCELWQSSSCSLFLVDEKKDRWNRMTHHYLFSTTFKKKNFYTSSVIKVFRWKVFYHTSSNNECTEILRQSSLAIIVKRARKM